MKENYMYVRGYYQQQKVFIKKIYINENFQKCKFANHINTQIQCYDHYKDRTHIYHT